MVEAERPGGAEPAAPRLRAFRGGATRRPRRASGPQDVSSRLAALEKQVESALARGRFWPELDAPAGVQAAIDQTLAVYAGLRRWLAGHQERARLGDAALRLLYRWWWRVATTGVERIPARGRVLVVANRSGLVLPFDALMLALALGAPEASGRRARPLVDEWLVDTPLLGQTLRAWGAVPATPRSLRGLLEDEHLAIAFPEGAEACAKPWDRRYRVARFAATPLLRVAIETGTPIVPVAIIGAEETQPVLWRVERLGRPLGLPALPVTPTFPWFGPLGLVPYPTKWTIHVGEPLDVAAAWSARDGRRTRAVRHLAEQVRERLQGLVSEGLRRRRGILLG